MSLKFFLQKMDVFLKQILIYYFDKKAIIFIKFFAEIQNKTLLKIFK